MKSTVFEGILYNLWSMSDGVSLVTQEMGLKTKNGCRGMGKVIRERRSLKVEVRKLNFFL